MALVQGDQALRLEVVVRPALMIAPASASLTPMTLAQDRAESSPHVAVHTRKDVPGTVFEVSKPAHERKKPERGQGLKSILQTD